VICTCNLSHMYVSMCCRDQWCSRRCSSVLHF